jgi:hypothetical protein
VKNAVRNTSFSTAFKVQDKLLTLNKVKDLKIPTSLSLSPLKFVSLLTILILIIQSTQAAELDKDPQPSELNSGSTAPASSSTDPSNGGSDTDSSNPAKPLVNPPTNLTTNLNDEPQIIRTGPVRVLRRSPNNKVFLINSDSGTVPRKGKVILLLKDKQPLVGLRVIKLYPGQKYFAAKRLKSYVDSYFLNSEESLIAMEKYLDPSVLTDAELPDSAALETSSTATASAPEEEPEPEIKEYDPDLDAATAPKPKSPSEVQDGEKSASEAKNDPAATVPEEDPQEEAEDELNQLMVDQPNPIDLHRHWISAGLAYL